MIDSLRKIPAFCPNCVTLVPKFVISNVCKCGYKNKMSLCDYITQFTQNKTRFFKYSFLCAPHMKQFTYYCTDCDKHLCDECYNTHHTEHLPESLLKLTEVPEISKAEDHLNYLSSLRYKFSENSQIQEAYQKCLTANKDVFYFANLLMKEYHKDNYRIFQVIRDIATLNSHKAFDEKEETVLNYFNSFGFASLKPFKTISTNNFLVFELLLLKDGRLAAVLSDQTIKIYDVNSTKVDITIQRESNSASYKIAQLDNGFIVGWESDKKMSIYSITKDSYKKEFETPNPHEKNAHQIMIALSENRLATCSVYEEVKIWNLAPPYGESSKQPIKIFSENADIKYENIQNSSVIG